MKIALIDYGAGNLHSCAKALEFALHQAGLKGEILLGANPDDIARADRIVLPGDGAFADCRAAFGAMDGLEDVLRESVLVKARPFLGICVGMQLLADLGEENGETAGLGWIPGRVVALNPADKSLKVPHMGWNTLQKTNDHPIFSELTFGETGDHAYFLHSFHMLAENPGDLLAIAEYGGPVSAIIGRGTIIGTQFHPEKSQKLGLTLLTNFLTWCP
jgi:imidazole glycerol-phosphate synthase subunit HisH